MSDLPPKGDSKQPEKEAKTPDEKSDKIEMLIATLVKINQSNRKADNAEHKRTDRREQRTFWLHIAEIILITVYAFFTVLEWKTFNSERQTMEQELGISQTNTIQQMQVLRGQLSEMQKTRELDERAWVVPGITHAQLLIDTNSGEAGGVIFRVHFKNTGRTPAINVVPVIGEFSDITNIPMADVYPNPVYNSMLLAPDEDGITATRSDIKTSLERYQYIKNGGQYYLAGTIWYDDIFGKHHWTQYCFVVEPDLATFTSITNHNTCDDAQTNQNN